MAESAELSRWARRREQGIKLLLILEHWIETLIFWLRWILAPVYLILGCCLFVLAWDVGEEFLQLVKEREKFAQTKAIAQVLVVVDLILVMNLVLMIIFVGYVNFVSRIHPSPDRKEDWPKWMGHLDYSGLKVQLIGSIIAVSAISILRLIVELADTDSKIVIEADRFIWLVVFHSLFLFSVLIIAIVNRMKMSVEGQDDRFRSA
jgi:uncharacterized protein (TIGR00645 family)